MPSLVGSEMCIRDRLLEGHAAYLQFKEANEGRFATNGEVVQWRDELVREKSPAATAAAGEPTEPAATANPAAAADSAAADDWLHRVLAQPSAEYEDGQEPEDVYSHGTVYGGEDNAIAPISGEEVKTSHRLQQSLPFVILIVAPSTDSVVQRSVSIFLWCCLSICFSRSIFPSLYLSSVISSDPSISVSYTHLTLPTTPYV